jgi:transcriptional regulator with XRE-family HTH domain
MTFGETLKREREQAGFTQDALAVRSGISIRTIQGWENSSRSPVSPDFFQVVKALGVPAERFKDVDRESAAKPTRASSLPRKGK